MISNKSTLEYAHYNFGPYLFRSHLPDEIIKELISEGLNSQESYNDNLAGHLDHQFLYPADYQKKFYGQFIPYLKAYRMGHCKFHGLDPSFPIEIEPIDLWVNFMKAGDFNPMHTHGHDLSFVIFASVPNEIHIEAKNFKGTANEPGTINFNYTQQAKPKWATTAISHLPKTGELFIFPALLQHWVAPFKSDVTRISISGNLRYSNKDKFPKGYF